MSERINELKVTKRIDPERVGRVLKQDRDSMNEMPSQELQSLIKQAEVDMGRCADASETLRLVSRELAEVMLIGLEVAAARNVRLL
ncbi:hypothetical protein KNU78_gp16 [Gordonia phage Sukkupi]|uniref:Uncharacterized protein n=1 Tax=Gordonia phage Sukkupi TaxID=2653747 RepID=A0A5Q2WNW0_9CAUD|nr:hypothetical protein KNU78_gp16 [Gordonia phage Sukkupi]QAU07065.1 hypothetical protein SEA_BIPAUNETO_16 [Gordonia phage BiPauneto]QGH79259.1 hypothetical protein SEA_SUKKUPI_16 [Gordonia phage Sukkupi]